MVGPFLGTYCTTADLVASIDDAVMAELYMVGMVMPQDAEEEDSDNNDIEALFNDKDHVGRVGHVQ
jgi:hypothetical protein